VGEQENKDYAQVLAASKLAQAWFAEYGEFDVKKRKVSGAWQLRVHFNRFTKPLTHSPKRFGDFHCHIYFSGKPFHISHP